MKSKKIRILAGIGAVIMMCTAAGCSSEQPSNSTQEDSKPHSTLSEASSEPEEVRNFNGDEFVIGSHWAAAYFPEPGTSASGDLVIKRIEELEEKYNCKLSYVSGTPEEFTSNFMVALASGQKYADVIDTNLWWYWGFQTAGYLEPLDDIKDLRLHDSTWDPVYSEATKVNGKTYGVNWNTWYHRLPSAMSNLVYFNKRILNDKNLEDPYALMEKGEWNWENFRSIARKAIDSKNGVYGISSMDSTLAGSAVRSNGVREIVQDKNGKYVFGLTDERTYEALNFVSDIINVDKSYDPDAYDGRVSGIEWTDTLKKFCDGGSLFFVYHSDFLLYSGFLDSMEDDYGVITFPKGPSGTSDYNSPIAGDNRVCCIPITADDKERSGFLLRKLAQPLEGTTADSWKETARRAYFRDDEGAEQYFKILENLDSSYNWITGAANINKLNEAYMAVVFDKTKTPVEALETIASSYQAEIDKFINKTA